MPPTLLHISILGVVFIFQIVCSFSNVFIFFGRLHILGSLSILGCFRFFCRLDFQSSSFSWTSSIFNLIQFNLIQISVWHSSARLCVLYVETVPTNVVHFICKDSTYIVHFKCRYSPDIVRFLCRDSPYVVHFRRRDCTNVVYFKCRDCTYIQFLRAGPSSMASSTMSSMSSTSKRP